MLMQGIRSADFRGKLICRALDPESFRQRRGLRKRKIGQLRKIFRISVLEREEEQL